MTMKMMRGIVYLSIYNRKPYTYEYNDIIVLFRYYMEAKKYKVFLNKTKEDKEMIYRIINITVEFVE